MQTGAFLTATGTTVGTPTYMAPEQAMAQEIGPWTDLYSVGCMAFELFTGNVPFHDTDAPMAILLRHVNEPIAPVKRCGRRSTRGSRTGSSAAGQGAGAANPERERRMGRVRGDPARPARPALAPSGSAGPAGEGRRLEPPGEEYVSFASGSAHRRCTRPRRRRRRRRSPSRSSARRRRCRRSRARSVEPEDDRATRHTGGDTPARAAPPTDALVAPPEVEVGPPSRARGVRRPSSRCPASRQIEVADRQFVTYKEPPIPTPAGE